MKEFDINKSLGYVVAKTNWYMKNYFNKNIKENNLDITPEQWAVLITINKNPGISQSEIAYISLKDKTNVTRILDLLEKKKYIVRNSEKKDRRAYYIYLTYEGENVLKKLIEIADKANNDYISGLQVDQITDLFKILNDICENIEKNR
jgi:MarR family transcriptional regulator, organic hydroperoxide resistance regulator